MTPQGLRHVLRLLTAAPDVQALAIVWGEVVSDEYRRAPVVIDVKDAMKRHLSEVGK